jgi:DNA-binding transcriptional MocR family regulator
LLRSHIGQGTFVCASGRETEAPFAWRGKVSVNAHVDNHYAFGALTHHATNPNLISFAEGTPALECFPIDEYTRLTQQVLRQKSADVLGLAPTEGQPLLRKVIGLRNKISPNRLMILSGAQEGLDLISRCLLDPGDKIITDRPCYVGALQTFRAAGANIIGWDVTKADFDELEDLILRYRPKFIYTNPTFQNPTGKVFTLKERREFLKLAVKYRVPVFEDDPYSETYLKSSAPPPSLYQLDTHNIVIYLHTFSKTLAPGLRLGWLAASEYIIDQLTVIKQRKSLFTEGLGQLVLAELLMSNLFDAHLSNLRKAHDRKCRTMILAIEKYLPQGALTFRNPEGGLYLWCRLKPDLKGRQFLQQAISEGVLFRNGEMFYPDDAGSSNIRLCFTGPSINKIEEGVQQLSKSLQIIDTGIIAPSVDSIPII